MGWETVRVFLSDDRDLRGRAETTLELSMGGNGDWYLSLRNNLDPDAREVCVRLAMSRGNNLPGLPRAMANLYRALGDDPPAERFEAPKYLLREEVELLIGFAEQVPAGSACPLDTDDPLILRLWALTQRRAP